MAITFGGSREEMKYLPEIFFGVFNTIFLQKSIILSRQIYYRFIVHIGYD